MHPHKEEEKLRGFVHQLEGGGIIAKSAVRNFNVLEPHGLGMWSLVKEELSRELRKIGFEDYYFPSLIPLSLFGRHKKHYSGFEDELALVTKVGKNKLSDPLAIVPTSEMIIYPYFAKKIRSQKDLPLKANQFCSVMRWEFKRPNVPLLRDNQFLWQESHSCHATAKEAEEMTLAMLRVYKKILEQALCLPTISGLKPGRRKFPGAEYTLALETLLPDNKAVQLATSHFLSQNFSKPLGISFTKKSGKKEHCWQSCHGITTRSLGAALYFHSDQHGLVVPPSIAPVQCLLVGKGFRKEFAALEKAFVRASIEDLSVKNALAKSMKDGIPVVVYKENGKTFLYRRDTNESRQMKKTSLGKAVAKELTKMHSSMFSRAKSSFKDRSFSTSSKKVFAEKLSMRGGLVNALWCGDDDCFFSLKKETGASLRLVNPPKKKGKCVWCNEKAAFSAYFAPSH